MLPKGLAPISPMSGLTLNAMVFKHSQYPNAAKAFLTFMMEKDQYEPWLNANSGYWSQPLAAYADAAVWKGDPKVAIFKDTMKSTYYDGYKGPISTATGAVKRRLRTVQMFASVATGEATPEAAAAEAERRCQALFPPFVSGSSTRDVIASEAKQSIAPQRRWIASSLHSSQ